MQSHPHSDHARLERALLLALAVVADAAIAALDCFVALLLAMTTLINYPHVPA